MTRGQKLLIVLEPACTLSQTRIIYLVLKPAGIYIQGTRPGPSQLYFSFDMIE